MIKKLIGIMIVVLFLFSLSVLTGCSEKPSKYSEDQHVNRISERIENRFINESTELTGFQIFPLYDEADELKYFFSRI